MSIHHATLKRATALGIELVADEDGTVTATKGDIELVGEDPKALISFVAVAAMLETEYGGFTTNDEGHVTCDEADYETDIDPTVDWQKEVARIVEEATAAGWEPEEREGSVVVAERYKAEYRARGDASGCGDWLHQTLKRFSSEYTDHEGNSRIAFDEPSFTKMLVNNGIEIKGKFAQMPIHGGKGWEGRYRMNGRQMLESPLLRAKGVLVLEDGSEVVMPQEDYEELLSKPRHKALREKIETEEEEADVAAAKKGKGRKAK